MLEPEGPNTFELCMADGSPCQGAEALGCFGQQSSTKVNELYNVGSEAKGYQCLHLWCWCLGLQDGKW